MEQAEREELLELTNTALNCIREIGKRCTKRSNKRLIHKAVKYFIWIQIALENGEEL